MGSAGLTFAFSVLIGCGIGYLLDRHFRTGWITPVFAGIGLVAGFRELFRAVRLVNRAYDDEARQRRAAETKDEE